MSHTHKRITVVVALSMIAASAIAALPHPVAASSPLRLIVTPTQGHVGDRIFLSGSGFTSRGSVSVYLKCGVQPPERVTTVRANGLGRFAGSRVRFALHKQGAVCRFLAASQNTPTVRAKTGVYTFVPARRPLAKCAVHMCLHVQAFLVRLKNNAKGNIVISGWPGATADVTVARTQAGAKFRELRLNWRGIGSVSTPIAPGLLKGLQARVFVRAHLGSVSGQSVSSFHVMFGNR